MTIEKRCEKGVERDGGAPASGVSRRGFLAAAAAGAAALALAGCSGGDQAADPDGQDAPEAASLEGRSLTFIGDDNFKPYRYVQTGDDGSQTVVGLDIAVADELASRLGFAYAFEPMPFSGTLTAIQNRQADFSMSLSSNPEREQTFDFTQGYFQPRVGVLASSDAAAQSVQDLADLRLVCMTGTVQNQMLTTLLPDAQLTTFDSADQAMQEVVAGRADAYVCDGAEGRSMAEANEGLTCTLLPSDETLDYVGAYRVMGWKGADFIPLFDQAISDMRDDGTLDSLVSEWVGPDFVAVS